MPEDMNLEVAHKLTEREETVKEGRRWEEVIEILGVLLLAVAAVATAWGGFQAAKGGWPPVDPVRRGGRGPGPGHHRRHRR